MTHPDESEAEAHLTGVTAQWQVFVKAFFQPPNELVPGRGVPELDAAIVAAELLLAVDPPGPIVLPAKLASGTRYVGVAFNDDQARSLRELLRSYLGNTWTDFDGRSLAGRADLDSLDAAAVSLAGGISGRVFRLEVANGARAEVRRQVRALLRALAERPPREARLVQPVGRTLGDFADACATGAEQAARAAFERLASDHRISAANRLFLCVQLLATFERWDDLEDLAGIGEVLHLPRPALTSDALARFALAKMPSPPGLAAFQQDVAPRFGALIESTAVIRSVFGARYYALWSLMAGELPSAIGARLAETGWADDEVVAALLVESDGAKFETDRGTESDIRRQVVDALDGGRYDTAVDLLARLPPSAFDLAAVVFAVRASLTRPAIDLLDRYRASLGAAPVDEALKRNPSDETEQEPTATAWTWGERMAALLSVDTASAEREIILEALEGPALAELVAPGGLDDCVAVVRACLVRASGSIDTQRGLDGCIDLVRDVYRTGLAPAALGELAMAIIELWAYHDPSGDRRRVRRIMLLVDVLLELGLAPGRFDELVELLRLGWDPFLTDADLEVGLDAIELLVPYRSDATEALDSFARPLLARIGPDNARRISDAALEVAADLALEFGLGIEVPRPETFDDVDGRLPHHLDGTVVALYSLMESAMERAAIVLRRRHPGLVVLTLAEHVASDQLRGAARTADLVVVMDRAAKHAATDALRLARGGRPLRYAAGKGSTSLIAAAEEGLDQLAGSSAA